MAMATSKSVAAFFSTEAQATQAIQALKSAGFQSNQIGAATADGSSSTTPSSGAQNTSNTSNMSTGQKVEAKTEGMWDSIKNFFEGDESGASSTTGSNYSSGTGSSVEMYADENAPDRASHEITNGGGRYANAYEPEDVSHSLSGMNFPDEHSRYFGHRLGTGSTGVVVTVQAEGREAEATQILESNGGDLGSSAGSYDYGSAEPVQGQQRIQLLGEVLRVHKDRISRGEVRIRKEVITEQQTVQVPVSREELVIERIPVNGQTEARGSVGQGSEIRIPLSEERASAETNTVVREEVSVGKRSIEEVREVGGTVRHEELEVEDETARNR